MSFRCSLTLLSLILVLGTCNVSNAQSKSKGKKKRGGGLTLVKVDRVKLMPQATGQTFVGSLEPVRRSVIGSAVEERVEEVFVQEGDYIDVSQAPRTLVKLRHDTVDIAVDAAKIELNLRQQAFQELEATIPTQIESARAEVARLNAELQFAKKVYDRTQSLASSMSKKEMEEAFSQYNSASQSINVARAELKRIVATQQIRMTIAKSNIARQESELNRNTDLQTKHSVTAPFSGHISRRMVEQGTWVTRGTPLVEMIQVNPIQLRVQVPQEYATALQTSFDTATAEQPFLAEIQVGSLEQPLTGTVFRIVPDADPRTRSIPVIIRIDNPTTNKDGTGGHLLKAGLLARANLQFGIGDNVLMVPKDALVLNQGAASIYLIDRTSGKPVVQQQPVATGGSNGNWIEVTCDAAILKEGVEVVVQGNERLRSGETVELLKL